MDLFLTFLTSVAIFNVTYADDNETVLYYYGLEESERELPPCAQGQACSALLPRYWRPRALLRLCRCARRLRCDTPAPPQRLVELNNRAHLQFCHSITSLAACTTGDTPLRVRTTHYILNPDEIERMHHRDVDLRPPELILSCRCRHPNYWRLQHEDDASDTYRCSSLPLCKTADFCGHVDNDLLALYQSCTCPENHICVHEGGVPRTHISELLYRGLGWRAFCQPQPHTD